MPCQDASEVAMGGGGGDRDGQQLLKEQRVSFLNQILAVTKDLEAINVAFIGLEWAEAITSEHEVYAQRLVDKGSSYQRDHGQQVLNFIHNIPEK